MAVRLEAAQAVLVANQVAGQVLVPVEGLTCCVGARLATQVLGLRMPRIVPTALLLPAAASTPLLLLLLHRAGAEAGIPPPP